ncbi:hypothetical protein [Agrobacterium pusense]|uniref:hypothetical protein n=1 Tax=Agrobacterium pusense TaxID=648995 RepID=UPI001C6F5805|nr:hypothetical protein [Agrobacterium pusense]MBW9067899.1 hypothetical protein [Agrobacterium pusense]MBW9082155.1 hypothetical protein [Agrobacterium pusense]MBW9126679.1 hypothetical protein [Agrobacterium pusense]MBW9139134.1 hypothetical protein [Agrobacterium pusense]
MALMILPTKEDGENAQSLLAVINIEIKDRLIFRDPTKAWQQFRHQCPLTRRIAEGLHIRFNSADAQNRPLECLRQRVAKAAIGLNEMVATDIGVLPSKEK